MNRSIKAASSLLLLLLVSATLYAATQWTVQVSSTKIRKDAKFWSGSLKTVQAGDRLEEVRRKGDWIEVETRSGIRGWIHKSAVTTKKLHLSGGSTTAGHTASAHEVSLAGKGFSEEVEAEYKKSNAALDFKNVERMSSITVSDDEIVQFMRNGHLAEWRMK